MIKLNYVTVCNYVTACMVIAHAHKERITDPAETLGWCLLAMLFLIMPVCTSGHPQHRSRCVISTITLLLSVSLIATK